MSAIKTGVFNDYILRPKSISRYASFRGVTDFSQIGKFNQYETGYQFLSVIQMPRFMTKLGSDNGAKLKRIASANKAFKDMLENEFRGLDGLPDIQAETYDITDGINTVRMINRVTEDTAVTVSMQFFEKQGSLIEKWSEYYLTGIKDLKTQAKTYHGLIRNGMMEPSLQNEVFTLLFYATDNTMLRLERAVLLCNAQLTKAEASMYNGSRSDISNHEVTVEFNCFPVRGELVDKAAKKLLQDITGVKLGTNAEAHSVNSFVGNSHEDHPEGENGKIAYLDSTDYRYGIMGNAADNISDDGDNPAKIAKLAEAIDK